MGNQKKLRGVFFLSGISVIMALVLLLPVGNASGAYLFNSTFTTGIDGWDVGNWGGGSSYSTATGQLCVTVNNPGANPWEVSIYRRPVALEAGHDYTISYKITASQNATIRALIQHNGEPYTPYYTENPITLVAAETQTITKTFKNSQTTNDSNVEMTFQVGNGAGNSVSIGTVICLDDISLSDDQYNPVPTPTTYPVAVNQLGYLHNQEKLVTVRTDADQPLPYTLKDSTGAEVASGIAKGPAVDDPASGQKVQVVDISKFKTLGQDYTLEITRPGTVFVNSDFSSGTKAPWDVWFSSPAAGTDTVTDGELCLNITSGGANTWEIGANFKQFALKKGQTYQVTLKARVLESDKTTSVRAKIGEDGGSYAEYWSKSLTSLTSTPQSVSETFEMQSDPPGSGKFTFDINFGGTLAGTPPFTVCLDDISLAETTQKETSHPFDIQNNLYANLKEDAQRYFYLSRSGMDLVMPYTGDAKWARKSGPVDDSVKCADPADPANPNPYCPTNYSLNVSKGWFDAGDYGKYVVNGGISVWTLQNLYERMQAFGDPDLLSDATNIPESGNKIPDLLDEARYEMEFLLSMQVPDGEPLAGMVHHKIHDNAWGPMPQLPENNTAPRYLHPVTTAATLNLAATAAQCARIWDDIDPTFANKCLVAAEKAWKAAAMHPDVLADANDGTGGGTYADSTVSDEFYWAAAELFITTDKFSYYYYLNSEPMAKYYLKIATGSESETGLEQSMTWGDTAALGTLSLSVADSTLPANLKQTVRANVIAAANTYLNIVRTQGYGVPTTPGSKSGYPWGSSATMLNNAIVMALASDFTGNNAYTSGVVQTMDYLLGRNPLDQSYISGYGEKPMAHPHHRFWGNETIDTTIYPEPPPGVVAGGPDSKLEDPIAINKLAGCVFQKCYIDNRDSFSTNEVAINWNAPLAWVSAFLDESLPEYIRYSYYLPVTSK